MNEATIELAQWHKDQLFKLLNGDDLVKYENGIYNLEKDLDSVLEKMKTKKKVLVRRNGKTFYREQWVGREESPKAAEKVGGNDKQRKEWHSELKSLIAERDRVKSDLYRADDLSDSLSHEMNRLADEGKDVSQIRAKYKEAREEWKKHNDKLDSINSKIHHIQDKIEQSYG